MIKKFIGIVSIAIVLVLIFNTSAANAVSFDDVIKTPLIPSGGNTLSSEISGMKENMEIRNLTNSNVNVCDVSWSKNSPDDPYYPQYKELVFNFKKVGTSIINGDFYYGDLSLNHFTTKVIVYKYKNPFKKIKIGKKNFTKKFNKSCALYLKNKKNRKVKTYIKMKKGFKMDNAYFECGKTSKTLKSKSTVKLKKKKEATLAIEVYNKKQKNNEYYEINYNY